MPNYRCGISGGTGGEPFFDDTVPGGLPDESFAVRLRIRYGTVVNSVQMIIDRPGAPETALPLHGSDSGTLQTITLERGETIEQISGKYGVTVDSILIRTNARTLGPFGGSGGAADYIYMAPTGHEIIGFIGRSGSVVDAIGVIITSR